jgi:hypothetical protein
MMIAKELCLIGNQKYVIANPEHDRLPVIMRAELL